MLIKPGKVEGTFVENKQLEIFCAFHTMFKCFPGITILEVLVCAEHLLKHISFIKNQQEEY